MSSLNIDPKIDIIEKYIVKSLAKGYLPNLRDERFHYIWSEFYCKHLLEKNLIFAILTSCVNGQSIGYDCSQYVDHINARLADMKSEFRLDSKTPGVTSQQFKNIKDHSSCGKFILTFNDTTVFNFYLVIKYSSVYDCNYDYNFGFP